MEYPVYIRPSAGGWGHRDEWDRALSSCAHRVCCQAIQYNVVTASRVHIPGCMEHSTKERSEEQVLKDSQWKSTGAESWKIGSWRKTGGRAFSAGGTAFAKARLQERKCCFGGELREEIAVWEHGLEHWQERNDGGKNFKWRLSRSSQRC